MMRKVFSASFVVPLALTVACSPLRSDWVVVTARSVALREGPVSNARVLRTAVENDTFALKYMHKEGWYGVDLPSDTRVGWVPRSRVVRKLAYDVGDSVVIVARSTRDAEMERFLRYLDFKRVGGRDDQMARVIQAGERSGLLEQFGEFWLNDTSSTESVADTDVPAPRAFNSYSRAATRNRRIKASSIFASLIFPLIVWENSPSKYDRLQAKLRDRGHFLHLLPTALDGQYRILLYSGPVHRVTDATVHIVEKVHGGPVTTDRISYAFTTGGKVFIFPSLLEGYLRYLDEEKDTARMDYDSALPRLARLEPDSVANADLRVIALNLACRHYGLYESRALDVLLAWHTDTDRMLRNSFGHEMAHLRLGIGESIAILGDMAFCSTPRRAFAVLMSPFDEENDGMAGITHLRHLILTRLRSYYRKNPAIARKRGITRKVGLMARLHAIPDEDIHRVARELLRYDPWKKNEFGGLFNLRRVYAVD